MAKATPQAGSGSRGSGPKSINTPGQPTRPAPVERSIETGAAPGGQGPGGETGEARDRQVAQSTALGSSRVPEIPDDLPESGKPNRPAHSTVPREREPKGHGATMIRPPIPPVGPAVIVKDLRKIPRLTGVAGAGMKDTPVEARTEDEALELANAKGRAVFFAGGWVCPSIVKERVA